MSELEMKSQEDLTPEDPVDKDQETDLKVDEGEEKDDLDETGEGKEAGEKEEEDKTPTVEEQLALRESENKELRVLLRDGKRATDELTQRIEVSEAALDKAGLITEEEKKAAADQQVVLDTRKRELDNILEATRLSNKYARSFLTGWFVLIKMWWRGSVCQPFLNKQSGYYRRGYEKGVDAMWLI